MFCYNIFYFSLQYNYHDFLNIFLLKNISSDLIPNNI